MGLPPMQRAVQYLSADANPDVRFFMSLLPETYMSTVRRLQLEDKVRNDVAV